MDSFLRNYITPLSLVSFAAVAVTGLMMVFGIRNHQLGELHEWFGIAFAVIAVLHLIRNAAGFSAMIVKTHSLIVIGVLGVVAMLLVGSALTAPGGGPHGPRGPHRHDRDFGGPHRMLEQRLGQASIAQAAPALGLTSEEAIERLRQGGLTVKGPEQSLDGIARANRVRTPHLYRMLLPPEP